ncbi:prolipoprotein diacylglyceryl transferase [Colwellia sp. 4_MG-2023]|jgi:phosphatidylglycerol:prolipoprotein diacylglycerol transferase|uniref:prolipoprotein diacylglyceryl transferase n=1 Tax=unclassified Colwellia TaxID=196834 RepID=UPI001C097DBA|nr:MULTISPECIES: prolipoprotein diacylglyceryl transferase [unclassified Colwellia]MBU2923860.1 prolipoprotein diacylglyceryl transferase [Colwellia sp. C2M11]MDO6488789.1 prolipoprotein diacylglyceryl transferase [Colwellia sp. 6_MG-2023]MDO6507679.1 prolipoprotein diacylglyceryl transferase [Colwellia sp. 5_MG-2023]MDO6555675.1 prolipoprotein diacylglyceryl transferase [Colwellia sp. 4_MG-2023]MDO6653068.1 prolipoprotein diacylglyceryl transferase [Colwellia sp. 3_MG-2023]
MTDQFLQFPIIDPIIFSIGPVALRWYGMMYLVGFLGAMFIANKAADKSGGEWTREQVSDLLFYGFLGVILGGRIGYVFFYQFDYFLAEPLYLFKIWAGGMSFHGGLLGVIAAVYLFARKTNKAFLTVGDFVAPLVPIGLGMGRLGNFINAELWGRQTDVPWAMVFPTDPLQLPRHPSQLYEFFLEGVVLFAILYVITRKPRSLGLASGAFLIGYGVFRTIIEFFREPDAHLGLYFSFITKGQILSLPMILGGVLIIYLGYLIQEKEAISNTKRTGSKTTSANKGKV